MIYGFLVGVIIASILTNIGNQTTINEQHAAFYTKWERELARIRSFVRLISSTTGIISTTTLIGLLILGS